MDKSLTLFIGLFAGVLFFIKVQVHIFLDKKNGYAKKTSTAYRINPVLLLFYFQKTTEETKRLKLICNLLWGVSLILLLVITFFGNP